MEEEANDVCAASHGNLPVGTDAWILRCGTACAMAGDEGQPVKSVGCGDRLGGFPPAVAEQLTRKLQEPGDDQQKYENEHAPNTWRRSEMARLGMRAMIGGLLASYLTATIAGILL